MEGKEGQTILDLQAWGSEVGPSALLSEFSSCLRPLGMDQVAGAVAGLVSGRAGEVLGVVIVVMSRAKRGPRCHQVTRGQE